MYINKIFITFCIITIVITIAIVIISKFNGITRINTTTTPINTDELTTTPINTDELTSTTPSDIQTTPQELTCANKYPKYNSTKLSIGNDKYGSYCMSIDPNSKDLFPTFLGPLKSDINTIYNEMKDNNLYIIKGYNKTFQDNQSDAMFQGNITNAGKWKVKLITYAKTSPEIQVFRFVFNDFIAGYDNIYYYNPPGVLDSNPCSYDFDFYNYINLTSEIYSFNSRSAPGNFISVQKVVSSTTPPPTTTKSLTILRGGELGQLCDSNGDDNSCDNLICGQYGTTDYRCCKSVVHGYPDDWCNNLESNDRCAKHEQCKSGCCNGQYCINNCVHSCPGWDCTIEGQYCFDTFHDYKCVNKQWVRL